MRQKVQGLEKADVLQRQLLDGGANAQIPPETLGEAAGGKEGELAPRA
jgi:hypothetical protein